jgi:hypothetical protein
MNPYTGLQAGMDLTRMDNNLMFHMPGKCENKINRMNFTVFLMPLSKNNDWHSFFIYFRTVFEEITDYDYESGCIN